MKLYHFKDYSETSTSVDRQNASDARTPSDLFVCFSVSHCLPLPNTPRPCLTQVDALHSLIYADVHGGQVVKHDFEAKFGRNAFNCTCEMWYFAEFVKVRKIAKFIFHCFLVSQACKLFIV